MAVPEPVQVVHPREVSSRTLMVVRPGQLNLMTAGRGISHSECSTPDTNVLHGVQLWPALPAADRFVDPRFDHYEPPPVQVDDHELRGFLGTLAGQSSPVHTFSPAPPRPTPLAPLRLGTTDTQRARTPGAVRRR